MRRFTESCEAMLGGMAERLPSSPRPMSASSRKEEPLAGSLGSGGAAEALLEAPMPVGGTAEAGGAVSSRADSSTKSRQKEEIERPRKGTSEGPRVTEGSPLDGCRDSPVGATPAGPEAR